MLKGASSAARDSEAPSIAYESVSVRRWAERWDKYEFGGRVQAVACVTCHSACAGDVDDGPVVLGSEVWQACFGDQQGGEDVGFDLGADLVFAIEMLELELSLVKHKVDTLDLQARLEERSLRY